MKFNYEKIAAAETASKRLLNNKEINLMERLQNSKLIKFLHSASGITFVQMTIVQESKKDKVDWILLSRIFQFLYTMTENHKSYTSIHINTFLIDSIATCLDSGISQSNFMEMIDFFRQATFWCYKEEFI